MKIVLEHCDWLISKARLKGSPGRSMKEAVLPYHSENRTIKNNCQNCIPPLYFRQEICAMSIVKFHFLFTERFLGRTELVVNSNVLKY